MGGGWLTSHGGWIGWLDSLVLVVMVVSLKHE